jgi:ubiquinone/menaquinone biosynthesis C-methylase UbiE
MIDHFGLIASFYDLVIRYRENELLLSYVDLPSDGYLLDVGGGTGRIAITLLGKAKHIIVADLSLGMLAQAASKSLDTACCCSEVLPFPADTFERIIMVDALHHVLDQQKTIDEMWRVLTPGGRIVIQEPGIQYWGVKFLAFFEKLLLMRSRILSAEKIRGLFPFENARITIERQRPNNFVIIEKT